MDLYIVGAGSVGGHIAVNYGHYGLGYKLCGFFDDDRSKIGKDIWGYPVLGSTDELFNLTNIAVVVGIAFPRTKNLIVKKLMKNPGIDFPGLISPAAWISENCTIGRGTVIYPGCSVNYATEIGSFVVMNMNCALGHDCKIGDFASLAPGVNLAGHTTIGDMADIGIGASTRQNVRVGKGAVIGGQCMVNRDIPENEIWAGVPAKPV